MTDSLNNTLKNLQNKVSQITSDTEQQTVSKNPGLINIIKSMYLYIIILVLCTLIGIIWIKPAFIIIKNEDDEDQFDKIKLGALTLIISATILGSAYLYFYIR